MKKKQESIHLQTDGHRGTGIITRHRSGLFDAISGHHPKGVLTSFLHSDTGEPSVNATLAYGTGFGLHTSLFEAAVPCTGPSPGALRHAGLVRIGSLLQPVRAETVQIPEEGNGISINVTIGDAVFKKNTPVEREAVVHVGRAVLLAAAQLMLHASGSNHRTTAINSFLWYTCLEPLRPVLIETPNIAEYMQAVTNLNHHA